MINQITLYLGAAFVTFWGIAHLFSTASVVRGFGSLSPDNKNILTMEWIIEGLTLIFIGMLVALVTIINPFNTVSKAVYWLAFGMLNVLSIVSIFTGFKVNFIAFKLCPVIFTGASILILWGILA